MYLEINKLILKNDFENIRSKIEIYMNDTEKMIKGIDIENLHFLIEHKRN